jgi:2-polyprenyl-3-methyl-5-hydroxy-6-metoxy-1,4-benzoquinol methylase
VVNRPCVPVPGDPINSANVFRFYDAGRGLSARSDRAVGWLDRLARRERQLVLELLAPAPGMRALDAGCGAGHHARALAARGLAVTAIDFSPRMLERVRPFVDETVQANLEQLALARTFDRIVCAGVLEFVGDPARCLARLASHLAPGGRLVVMVPRRSFGGHLYRLWHRWKNAIVVHLFTAAELERAAERSGLERLACLEPFVHDLIIAWVKPVEAAPRPA